MNKKKTEAIVLKHSNYSDLDQIYTLFTKDFGLVRCRAFGVRKITSKRVGSLDTLNLISISYTEKNGFNTVDEVLVLDTFAEIKSNQDKIFKSYYLVELILKALQEEHPEPVIYALFKKMLLGVAKYEDFDVYISFFEIRLLTELGYDLPLDDPQKLQTTPQVLDILRSLYAGKMTKEAYKAHKPEIDRIIKSFVKLNVSPWFKSLSLV